MKKPRTLLQQMVVDLIHAGQNSRTIARTASCPENTVYRIARQFSLEVHRPPRVPRKAHGGFVYCRRTQGRRGLYQTLCVYVPAAACHAAGWKHGQQLVFAVAHDAIIIKPPALKDAEVPA